MSDNVEYVNRLTDFDLIPHWVE